MKPVKNKTTVLFEVGDWIVERGALIRGHFKPQKVLGWGKCNGGCGSICISDNMHLITTKGNMCSGNWIKNHTAFEIFWVKVEPPTLNARLDV